MSDLILPNSENQSKGYVADGDTKTRVQLTAAPSGSITLSPNENSPYGYITDAGGKKHRVLLTAPLYGSSGTVYPVASAVALERGAMTLITGGNVQEAMEQIDNELNALQDSVSVLTCSQALATAVGGTATVPLTALTAVELDGRPSHKRPGAMVYDLIGTHGIIHTVDETSAVITTIAVSPSASLENGMRGDYCSQYAVIKSPNGYPTVASGNKVVLPAGMVLECPGTRANPATPLITLASAQTITLTNTTDCYLIYAGGSILECNQICWLPIEPAQTSAKCSAWFDGTEWKVRDDEHGNVWVSARGQPLMKCIFTDGVLTRLSFVGFWNLQG